MRASAALLAVLAAAVLAGGASANSTATVSLVGCILAHGQASVPAGSTVDVRFGWATSNRGLDEAFLRDVTTTASVDGSPVANADSYWTTPAYQGPNPTTWVTNWLYPTGVTLGSDETLTISIDVNAAHPVPDGFGNTASADVFSGTCTITGS